jgi:hypothetical protein
VLEFKDFALSRKRCQNDTARRIRRCSGVKRYGPLWHAWKNSGAGVGGSAVGLGAVYPGVFFGVERLGGCLGTARFNASALRSCR